MNQRRTGARTALSASSLELIRADMAVRAPIGGSWKEFVRCLSAVPATEFAKPVCVKKRLLAAAVPSPRGGARVRGNDGSTAAACSLIREEGCSCLAVLRCTPGRTGSRRTAVFPLALRAGRRQTCVRLLRFGSMREQFAQRWLITTMTVT